MVSNGEHQVGAYDVRNEFEAWAALAHGSTYATFLRNCRDTGSYASEQAHYDYIAFRGGWLSALGRSVDMFEGRGAVVVGGDDFYASLSTLPDGAVIGAALSKDLFEKIAEEYGIAR